MDFYCSCVVSMLNELHVCEIYDRNGLEKQFAVVYLLLHEFFEVTTNFLQASLILYKFYLNNN